MRLLLSNRAGSMARIASIAAAIIFSSSLTIASAQNCLSFGGPTGPILADEYADVRLTIVTQFAGSGSRALSLTTQGNTVDLVIHAKGDGVECQSPAPSALDETISVVLAGRSAGSYRINLRSPDRAVVLVRDLIVSPSGATPVVAESLVFGPTQRYFLTTDSKDLRFLGIAGPPFFEYSSGGTWPLWAKADAGFKVWAASSTLPAAAKSVCRFFNSKVASHFYSASAADCAALRGLADWVDEGIAFGVLLPTNGVCPEATNAVYRLFSASLANHRYTPERETYAAMIANGWAGEGVAFCSPR